MVRDSEHTAISRSGSICSEQLVLAGPRYSCQSRKTSISSRKSQDPTATSTLNKSQQIALTKNHNALKDDDRKRINKSFHHYRFVVIMFGGASVGAMFLLRYNITVAILNMVNQTALYMEEHPGKTMDDFYAEGNTPGGEFHWNNEIQQMIMSSYMLTYTLPQLPVTKLGLMLGIQWMVPLSLGVCILSSVLTPTFSYLGYKWVVALRLVNGLGATAVLPMMIELIENWMPYDQLSLGLTCSQITFSLFNPMTPLITGYFSTIHWSWAFYGPSALIAVLCALWLIMITSTPENNWLVSKKELDRIHGIEEEVIESKTKSAKAIEVHENDEDFEPHPWYVILKERSLYCYLTMYVLNCSAFSVFTFSLPLYLRQFYKISIEENGIYSGLIQSGGVLAVLWPYPILSLLQSKFNFTETLARRSIHIFITSIVMVTYLFVGFFHKWQLVIFFLNRVLYFSNDIIVMGTLMSNYAKAGLSCITFSLANTIGNITVIPVSILVGWLLDKTGQSEAAWCCIMIALAVAQLLFCLIFITTVKVGPIDFGPRRRKNVEENLGEKPITKSIVAVQNDYGPHKNERAVM